MTLAPAPAPPTPDLGALIGQYGVDRPELDIYERDGALFANGLGLSHIGVEQAEARLHLHPGQPAIATIGEIRLTRRDFAAEAVAAFRRTLSTNLDRLREASSAATPPTSIRAAPKNDLVQVDRIDPSIRIDMRYASTDNFTGLPLYDRAAAFLQRPAAAALAEAQAELVKRGYSLMVLDAYRPWSVTWLFWQVVPPKSRQFVADPVLGSKHNRGCAVDVTLVDLAQGQPVDMPSGYDEPSARAAPNYYGGSGLARWNRDILRNAMEAAGFSVDPYEWWHYDFGDWATYPILNTPLSQLE